MTFLQPAALALLSTWLLVLLFSLLRARQRRREVAALFLWQELRDSAAAHPRNLQHLVDPLLLLQLACVLALALALAQPAWTARPAEYASLALVIDGSASMRTNVEPGRTRYDEAIDRALAYIGRFPSASVSVVQWSFRSQVLATDSARRADVQAALRSSVPTWSSDGDADELARALFAVGGPSGFERILVLTDHPVETTPFPIETALITGGKNVAITAFTVRERADRRGVVAFVELHNGTDAVQAGRLQILDELNRTTIETFLESGETAPYVVPFPGSRGTRFTATLDTVDDFPADNVRYFSLERPVDLRVRWIGTENRFLRAALESVLPVAQVDDKEPADLTIAYDVSLQQLPDGNVLLVHADVAGIVSLGAAAAESGTVRALIPDDPLLAGIRAADIYVERLPAIALYVPSRTLLGVGTSPFLVSIDDPDRSVILIASDLYATNFPITVDFPLFVRTFVGSLLRAPSPLKHEWVHVWDTVRLPPPPTAVAVVSPDGQAVPLLPQQRAFFPDRPGQYTLVTDDGRYPLSVNVDPTESATLVAEDVVPAATGAPAATRSKERVILLWPVAAWIAFAFLLGEFALFRRRVLARRRIG